MPVFLLEVDTWTPAIISDTRAGGGSPIAFVTVTTVPEGVGCEAKTVVDPIPAHVKPRDIPNPDPGVPLLSDRVYKHGKINSPHCR